MLVGSFQFLPHSARKVRLYHPLITRCSSYFDCGILYLRSILHQNPFYEILPFIVLELRVCHRSSHLRSSISLALAVFFFIQFCFFDILLWLFSSNSCSSILYFSLSSKHFIPCVLRSNKMPNKDTVLGLSRALCCNVVVDIGCGSHWNG